MSRDDNSGTGQTSPPASPEAREGSIWEHLDELFVRARKAIFAVLIAAAAVLFFPDDPAVFFDLSQLFGVYRPAAAAILRKLEHDLLPLGVILIAGNWVDPLEAYLLIGLTIGFVISSPIVAYEVYKFVNPALYEWERKALYGFVSAFVVLFATGMIFSYYLIVPFTFNILTFFVATTGAQPFFQLKDFIQMTVLILLASGLAFSIPVFFVLLVKFGILSTEAFTKRRAILYAAIFIVTAIITPDPTPITDILLFVPVVALMELAVYLAHRMYETKPRSTPTK